MLFHTSGTEIKEINEMGRFGAFLFFSPNVYKMTAGSFHVYSIDEEKLNLIDADSLFYHADYAKLDGLVAKFAARFDVSIDEAEEIISERAQLDSTDADDLWDVQVYTAKAAQILGFDGVCVKDEQGSAYMINMLNRLPELQFVRVEN